MSDSPPFHNIVVLGASFAGLGVAHGILKAIPSLESQTKKKFKVTLIADNTHFWFTIGAPRAMLKPYPNSNDDSFIPISKGLSQYPPEKVEFVHARVTGLDPDKREVFYKSKNENEELSDATLTLHFDTIVIAAGSSGASPVYSLQGSHIPTLDAYKDIQARLPSAKTVCVIGGGSAGTETAGELGSLHGKNTAEPKDITILSGGERLLPALRPAIGTRAQEMLTALGVKVEHNLRLTNSKKLRGGAEELTFSDGSTRTVDLLLVATGRFPASSFLPKSLLDDKKKVIVDPYMRIPSIDSAYAVGDIASNSPGGALTVKTQVSATFTNVIAELSGKGKGKEWKPMTTKEMQIVPVGPDGGVGAIFGWWLPSFGVKMIKSKTFMFPMANQTVMGTA